MKALLAGERDILKLAEELGLTPAQFAEWGEDEALPLLASLCELAEAQAQLLVSRVSLCAAHRLHALASQADDEDLARKACVDLLKLQLWRGGDLREQEDADPAGALQDLVGEGKGVDDAVVL